MGGGAVPFVMQPLHAGRVRCETRWGCIQHGTLMPTGAASVLAAGSDRRGGGKGAVAGRRGGVGGSNTLFLSRHGASDVEPLERIKATDCQSQKQQLRNLTGVPHLKEQAPP